MRNELLIKRNKEVNERTSQVYMPLYEDLCETNRQSQLLSEQLLKDKADVQEKASLQSTFFANMIHEIRTPVSIIKSFAQLLKAPDLLAKDKEEYAQIIDRCSDDLLNLINDLLDISKIEAGELTFVEKPGNLKDLFGELSDMFDVPVKHYKQGAVKLETCIELPIGQYQIYADFTRLKQVFVNLISNALKFTLNGHVLFGCRLINNKTIQFYVEDTGIGIKPEMQAVIFERYKQVNDPCLTSKCKGTGLGLPIVQSLVRSMKGKIWMESEYGVGSTFYFNLPYRKVKSIASDVAA
ncbi:MAG TPA: HAMP domain-containing sensor histidine kinase [Bacteroidales bacterium]